MQNGNFIVERMERGEEVGNVPEPAAPANPAAAGDRNPAPPAVPMDVVDQVVPEALEEVQLLNEVRPPPPPNEPRMLEMNVTTNWLDSEHITTYAHYCQKLTQFEDSILVPGGDPIRGKIAHPCPLFELHPNAKSWIYQQPVRCFEIYLVSFTCTYSHHVKLQYIPKI